MSEIQHDDTDPDITMSEAVSERSEEELEEEEELASSELPSRTASVTSSSTSQSRKRNSKSSSVVVESTDGESPDTTNDGDDETENQNGTPAEKPQKKQRKRKSTLTQLPGEIVKKGKGKNGASVNTSSTSGSDAGDEAEPGNDTLGSINGSSKKIVPEGYTIAPSGRKIKNDHPPGSRMCHMCHVFVLEFVACTALKTRAKGKTVKCDLAWW